jgi:hypothetical protein
MYRDGSKGKAIFEDFTRLIEKSLKFHLSDRFQSGSALTTYSWRDASRKKMFLFPSDTSSLIPRLPFFSYGKMLVLREREGSKQAEEKYCVR